MHIISVNMAALPHCQVRDKQNGVIRYYIIPHFATLPTRNCSFENFSAFNTIYRCIRERYKKCMLWRLSPDIYRTQQDSHCETTEQSDSRLLISICGAVWRKHTSLLFCVICRWGILHWHVDIHEQNGRFCASQQLLLLLANEMTCREISVLCC